MKTTESGEYNDDFELFLADKDFDKIYEEKLQKLRNLKHNQVSIFISKMSMVLVQWRN